MLKLGKSGGNGSEKITSLKKLSGLSFIKKEAEYKVQIMPKLWKKLFVLAGSTVKQIREMRKAITSISRNENQRVTGAG